MKILVGAFQCESNTFSAAKAGKENFYILHGDEAKDKLFASHLFEEAGFEIIECEKTDDVRPGRDGEKWVNVIAMKK